MQLALQLFIWIPLLGFVTSLFVGRKKEKIIASVASVATGLQLGAFLLFLAYWWFQGFPTLDAKHIVLYNAGNIEIFIDFFFDRITAVFALVGSILAVVVVIFSRYYMHRDGGFKRYFSTILLFFLAYNLIVFAGNFETLFIGWEALGVCSFILIAFYRDRYLPVKNAMKVISIYRFGDICLVLSMWMSHHLWHENITFLKLQDHELVSAHLHQHGGYAVFIILMILVASLVKSAQFPFSSWLPRAMEGPTTSSAIFYGSLSVHLGVFLLLRTYPYWSTVPTIQVLLIVSGVVTSIIASGIAKVQSSVKAQIAYASTAQIGLMFIEIALGFHTLALLHFAGNAFLRTYQLLVSPSTLSYLIHNMVFSFTPKDKSRMENAFYSRVRSTFFMLSMKEWNIDSTLHRFMWNPPKMIGKKLEFLASKTAFVLLVLVYFSGWAFYVFESETGFEGSVLLPHLFSVVGLMVILKAFAERGNALRAWFFIFAGQLFITVAITLLNDNFGVHQIILYLSGSSVSFIGGFLCLKKIERTEHNIQLEQFHGHTYEYPRISFLFLICCLGLVGLPFTPTFIGVDLVFSHIGKQEELVLLFTAMSFVVIELAALRIYSRIFLGQHNKTHHAMAFKSS